VEAGEAQMDVPRDLRLLGVQVASRLRIAPRTAEAHVENYWRKLEVCSRAQNAAWATERRLSLVSGSVVRLMSRPAAGLAVG
jgi:hypothetical protein